ncbi:MAG: coenzyme F420-0:L-glutamate ligase [Anaerolineae bacterium]|nr:coenzyme F420-0:L-glutamate ligase [Anaerolineae bacterium]
MQIIGLSHIPLIQTGDDLSDIILTAAQAIDLTLAEGDIIVVAQKIISKAEDQWVNLATVTPSDQALELAAITGKPAALIEVILWDTATVIRAVPGLLIVEHKLGFISANAGIDHSNVSAQPDFVLRLPADPDASARALRSGINARTGVNPPVLIIDSHGRPWRFGTVGVTIGLSGLAPVQDLRGTPDLFNEPLLHTDVGFADQIAAAASLVIGQAAEGCPVAIVRGLPFTVDETAKAADVLRPKHHDLFR